MKKLTMAVPCLFGLEGLVGDELRRMNFENIRVEDRRVFFEGDYAAMNIRFVEEDPFLVNFRAKALPLMQDGFLYIPCASVFNRCDWNTVDLMEYFRDNGIDRQILGYVTAPWVSTLPTEKNKMFYEESFRFFREARREIYGE